ncbi:MAG: uroporphyrinogen-III C-methyltransferase [Candidatus Eremiobacteraeota bacterium]|nr:uroporphyrinogen-III C-methyltransferase [Candidatus Eremiobacteraeota bacterium]
MRNKGKVFIVGAGPGDPGLLTLKAARAIRNADVLLHDYLASPATVALAPETCEKIYVGKEAGKHTLSQSEINDLMVRKAGEGKRVVRLKGGDPFVFGRGAEEAQELREAGIAFEIIPGITSSIAAPAYAGIPVTHRSHNTAFTVLTGHEDPTKSESTIDWSRFADPHQTLVLLMAMGNLPTIVAKLLEAGLSGQMPAAVIREGTRPSQQTIVSTLATLVEDVAAARIGSPAIVVIGEVVGVREQIAWFDAAPLFGKNVLITRPAGQSAEFATELLERGAQPILAPTISIGVPDDAPPETLFSTAGLAAYEWIVFTSANAVDAFFKTLETRGKDTRALRDLKIAAIGPKTAQALQRRGIHADLVPKAYVAEDLANAMVTATAPGTRILLYRAQEARDVFPALLTAQARIVDDVAAYKTSIVKDSQFAGKVAQSDIITFTSASTVEGFLQNLGPDAPAAIAGKIVACIGPITAKAASDAGLHVEVIAQEFTVEGLVEALEKRLLSTVSASLR